MSTVDSGWWRRVHSAASVVTKVPLWWRVASACVRAGGQWQISVPTAQVFCEPKTALTTSFLPPKAPPQQPHNSLQLLPYILCSPLGHSLSNELFMNQLHHISSWMPNSMAKTELLIPVLPQNPKPTPTHLPNLSQWRPLSQVLKPKFWVILDSSIFLTSSSNQSSKSYGLYFFLPKW